MAAMACLFLFFYIHNLCNLISRRLIQRTFPVWNYSAIATAFVIIELIGWALVIPDQSKEPIKYFSLSLILNGALLCLMINIQRHANLASDDPDGV